MYDAKVLGLPEAEVAAKAIMEAVIKDGEKLGENALADRRARSQRRPAQPPPQGPAPTTPAGCAAARRFPHSCLDC